MKIFGEAEGYRAARRSLVRILRVLSVYEKEAIVVVGAQAIYLQCADDDLPFSPFTLDTDLALDPRRLSELPPIRRVLEENGYRLRDDQPGMYRAWSDVGGPDSAVDLLVPEEFAFGAGGRDARLPGDNERAARRTAGLEATLYDKDLRRLTDPHDDTVFADAYVAGPAALILSKAQKIAERSVDRLKAKDAADVFRLLRTYDAADVQRRIAALRRVAVISTAVDGGIRGPVRSLSTGRKGANCSHRSR